MKKGSRQSHPGKSAAMKQDTSQAEMDGDSTNTPLTGVFCEDFSILCERAGLSKIPLVVYTPKVQCGTSIEDLTSLGSRLHVTLENDDPNSLKHVHFRNMKMNRELASILLEASKECQAIQSLSLWNTGMPFSDHQTAGSLVNWMKAHNLHQLSIGATSVSASVFSELIGTRKPDEESPLQLQKLSLKCCQLNDTQCEELCRYLEFNKTLLSLHLGCNSITDAGLFHISKALKRNRTLLTLSLMGNKITDEGAIGLAKVLSRFSLSHSEMIDRRKLLLDKKGTDEDHQTSLRSSPSTASLSDRSSRQTKGSNSDKGKAASKTKQESGSKKEDKLKKDDKSKKAISSPDPPKKAQKGGRDSKMVTAKKATQLESHPPSPKIETTDQVTGDPLLEEGEEVDGGTIILPGNVTLASLSLSNNLITDRGLEAFLDAIEIQKQYSHRGQGLIRLEFKNNLFSSSTSSVARELEEVMMIRDPYYEPPPPEDDTVTMETTDNSVTLPNI